MQQSLERPKEGPQAKDSLFAQHAKAVRDRSEHEKTEIERQLEQERQIMESLKQQKREMVDG